MACCLKIKDFMCSSHMFIPSFPACFGMIETRTATVCDMQYNHSPQHTANLPEPAVQVLTAVRQAAKGLHLSSLELMSKPYHDAAFMGLVAPTAMIFVPCKGGLSHHPDEYSSPKNVGDGVRTLALTLAHLAGSAGSEEAVHSEL